MSQFNVTAGDRIVINGDILEVVRIAGRWVYLSDDSTVSRAVAQEARDEYLDDAATLGDELYGEDSPAQADEGTSEAEDDAPDMQEVSNVDPDAEDAPEAEEVRVSRSIVPDCYRKSYTKSRTATGNSTLHCGDDLAAILNGVPLDRVEHVATLAGTGFIPKMNLNNGQRSMNARNTIRNAIKNGYLNISHIASLIGVME